MSCSRQRRREHCFSGWGLEYTSAQPGGDADRGEGIARTTQQAHLNYVISLAPFGSSSEPFFRDAAGDKEILAELRRRAEAAQDAAAAAHYRALALVTSGWAPHAVSLFQELVGAFPTKTVTA
jgi:hypothetical protein